MTHLRTHIAGIPHRKPAQLPHVGSIVSLVPEPTNPFDPNAIKVMYDVGPDIPPIHLGYIPKTETATVRAFDFKTMKVVEVVPERKWTEVIIEAADAEETRA